jgi:hypothetical protein
MTRREVELYSTKKCKICGESIEKGLRALANVDERPWTFLHLECAQGPKDEQTDDFKEMVLAILSDHSQDLIAIKQIARTIEDKLVSLNTVRTVEDAMGGKK